MCGILGYINKNKQLNKELFLNSLNLLSHRGPDDSGIYEYKNILLGHRRLSIIDLDNKAAQPMVSECGNYVIIYNGEIYNFQEIKKYLLKKGYRFKTKSDTEVLLYSFIEDGIECVKNFIGMFAFTILDKKRGEIYLVRDRLGIKPLYYYEDDNSFIFSSEIKSILKLLSYKPLLNIYAVSSYLSYRYPILNDTFFENIVSLPPAHYKKIELKSGKSYIQEYWNVSDKFKEQQEDKGEEFYIKKIRDILSNSVKYRMIADVPLGSFLSGGVDSSVVTALMVKNSDKPINTFTIGFKEEGYNEFEYARVVANKYHTNHHEIILEGKDYIENLQTLIHYKDAPLSVPNEVPLYLMSKELKKYITVVLSGEGADEIFGGYGRIFRSPYDFERLKNLKNNEEFMQNFKTKYKIDNFPNELEHFLSLYRYTSIEDKRTLLHSSIDIDIIEQKLNKKFLHYFKELKNESYYNKIMYTFEKIHILGLLHRVDTTTMAASVEARVPFVDHRLVEFAFTIPVKYKLKWIKERPKTLMSDKISENFDIPKYILKKAFEKELPKEILYRRKVGFPVPLHKWFGKNFNNYANSLLLSQKAKERNLYNVKNIQQWLNSDRLANNHSFAMKIWMLVNLELFIKKYFD